MDCEEVLSRLWEYLDQELEPDESTSMDAHLQNCPWCHPACCRDSAFLRLLARQRDSCSAPLALALRVRSLPH
jgi:anti-sigma factor RsiW